MQTESELREDGFQWSNVMRAFLWSELSVDFERQLVEYDPVYKTQLEHHLLAAFHRYSKFSSFFYYNMYRYIKAGLAEQKQLKYYLDHIYMMYRQQRENQINASLTTYNFVDGATGRILQRVVL